MEPFRLEVAQEELDDLHRRLDATRWAAPLHGGWELGAPVPDLQALAHAWQAFDWRAFETELNAHEQVVTTIDGTRVHALVAPSPNPDAVPLVLTHGWPGSVVEVLDVLPLLREDFHVVAPSLPGYGLSGPTPDAGWDPARMADAVAALMTELGHERFVAQGGDWGSEVSLQLGVRHPGRVLGVHVNMLALRVKPEPGSAAARYRDELSGYAQVQRQRPGSLMHAFTDSPVGLLAWIAERFHDWTDPQTRVAQDRVLANVGLYWFTRTTGSAAMLYREALGSFPTRCEVPVGVAVFPHDLFRPTREQAEAAHRVVRFTELDRGGHFAALEVPELLAADVRAFAAGLR